MPRVKSAPEGPARFVSKVPNHTIVIRKTYTVTKPNGEIEVQAGKRAKFVNGELITDDPEVLNFLRKYRMKDIDYTEDEDYALKRAPADEDA